MAHETLRRRCLGCMQMDTREPQHPMTQSQDTQHNQARAYPTQEEQALRSVVEKSGLPLVGYEYKVLDSDRQGHYFDIAVLIKDRVAFIDLADWRHNERDTAKATYCKEKGIALLQIPMGTGNTLEWTARVELWLMTL